MEKIGSICILNREGLPLKKGPLRIYRLIAVSGSISPYIRRGPFFRTRPPRFKMQMDPIFSVGWMPYITRLPGKK